MSNFIETYKQGKEGRNFGFTTGITPLDLAINRIQKKTSIGILGAAKTGKTTLTDFCFVINPYLEAEKTGKLEDIEWNYWSFEIDRVSKEFKFAAFFMAHDYNIYTFTYKGKTYQMNGEYLQGKMLHRIDTDATELIPVAEGHEILLKEIYYKRIIPLFGEWTDKGELITKGKITFIEERDNPTGMWKYLLHHAEQNGEFSKQKYTTLNEQGNPITKERITGYKSKNSNKLVINITDHMRKLKRERGYSMKENIDKWLEYQTELRNLVEYTFINVVHSNRALANMDRLRYAGEFIFPTGDDTKDSGNFAEECTILMSIFNPNDEKYNLKKHFGVELENFPNYRSIHVTESRNTECPVHIQSNMYGGIGVFTSLLNNFQG